MSGRDENAADLQENTWELYWRAGRAGEMKALRNLLAKALLALEHNPDDVEMEMLTGLLGRDLGLVQWSPP